MGLDPGLALLHPGDRSHAAGEHGKDLPEHALAAVAVDDALVVDELGRGFCKGALRHAGRGRLCFQIGKEAVEAHAGVTGSAAACGRRCGWFDWSGNRPGWICSWLSRCWL